MVFVLPSLESVVSAARAVVWIFLEAGILLACTCVVESSFSVVDPCQRERERERDC